jgi:hypothetical protein
VHYFEMFNELFKLLEVELVRVVCVGVWGEGGGLKSFANTVVAQIMEAA